MADFELVLLVFCYAQPPIMGFVLFLLARPALISRALAFQLRGVRKRQKSVRFFECAVYARLIGHLRYDIQILAFCALFIIYDVDLVFFLAEATHYELWG